MLYDLGASRNEMARNVNVIGEVKVYRREETPTVGIRTVTPFAGMFAEVGKLRKELDKWLEEREVDPGGHAYLRYFVIDMEGDMDVEFGYCMGLELEGDDPVRIGSLPAGEYAGLVYSGSGLRGNRALIEEIRSRGLTVDRWDCPEGDAFGCRYEMYLTDPKIEPRKTKWEIEVAMKLKN